MKHEKVSELNITDWRSLFASFDKSVLPFLRAQKFRITQIFSCYNQLSYLLYDTTPKTKDKKFRMHVASFILTQQILCLFPALRNCLYLHLIATHIPAVYHNDESYSFEIQSCDRLEGAFAKIKKIMKTQTNRHFEDVYEEKPRQQNIFPEDYHFPETITIPFYYFPSDEVRRQNLHFFLEKLKQLKFESTKWDISLYKENGNQPQPQSQPLCCTFKLGKLSTWSSTSNFNKSTIYSQILQQTSQMDYVLLK